LECSRGGACSFDERSGSLSADRIASLADDSPLTGERPALVVPSALLANFSGHRGTVPITRDD
jgi:hypothetical protein